MKFFLNLNIVRHVLLNSVKIFTVFHFKSRFNWEDCKEPLVIYHFE